VPRITPSSHVERFWAADERTAAQIKPQQPVRVARNPDPDAAPDSAGLVVVASKPQPAFAANIAPIDSAIDLQRHHPV
jgi:hypothetical protein